MAYHYESYQACRDLDGVIVTPLVQAPLLQCTSLSLCLSTSTYIYPRQRKAIGQYQPPTDTTTSSPGRAQKQTFSTDRKKDHVDANPTGRGQEQRAIRCVVHLRPSRFTTCEEIPCRYALTSKVDIDKV
jgi:hypothetical protein